MKKSAAPKKDKKPPTQATHKVDYKKIESLTDLIMVAGPGEIVVERIAEGSGTPTGLTLVGRRLKPNEMMEVNILLEAALPTELPPEKPGDPPRYDFRNPDYLRTKIINERKARAYALLTAFPIFGEAFKATPAGAKPHPSHEDMLQFIDTLAVEDDLLESAYRQLVKCVITVDFERVIFTSGGNSPKS